MSLIPQPRQASFPLLRGTRRGECMGFLQECNYSNLVSIWHEQQQNKHFTITTSVPSTTTAKVL